MPHGVGRLTTHVLDTTHGRPAAGVDIRLFRIEGEQASLLLNVQTNADGRCERPLLEGVALAAGIYELRFAVGAYFARTGSVLSAHPFLDEVPVRFCIADADEHYHVPLLISPYAYSTYRGS
ncbi:5-hydroxyisourate hydrolase [Arboricoccus pini]|uniref:5-hydroxyisourate hydrolase n=1 Tax=Arboricoccus pini TaxID=1963835 RepID=A0A212PWA0_9PROT|nr:hydroxyisourate hydrolase [Arboricoccus pini]SNB51160.1 5-hydroxyisourate hydrolase [Arboricoccus pini]